MEPSFKVIIGTDHQRIAKLDRENEVAPPPKVAPSVGRVRFHFAIIPREYPLLTRSSPLFQAMQTARQDLKLSQKDIAQKVNEKPSVIQDYESGRAVPNPQILGKLERALGVKLRGA